MIVPVIMWQQPSAMQYFLEHLPIDMLGEHVQS